MFHIWEQPVRQVQDMCRREAPQEFHADTFFRSKIHGESVTAKHGTLQLTVEVN
jgi:hypothetical protein